MITRKHLFLDLEDTVIAPVLNGWWNTELMNVEKIKRVIEEFQPDVVNIFSFAIHNDRERDEFVQSGTKAMVEKALGCTISAVPTVENEIIDKCCNAKWLSHKTVDFMDIRDFWGKHDAFRLSCQELFKNNWLMWMQETEVMLLDDDVMNENFEWPDLHVKGRIINIDTIREN
jgi:hypothetical protein